MIGFFINRPIFASVIAAVILIAGGVSLFLLPVASYPRIAPPVVRVATAFTGGSAQTVADSVATPLEQAINGVDGLIYISSSSSNEGQAVVEATFEVGYDADIAAVDVLTRVNQARPSLPPTVRDAGLSITRTSPQITAVVSLFSPDDRFDETYLSNYATINLVQALNRVGGVGRIRNFSEREYAIRIWLDPARMEHLGLSTRRVVEAVRRQSAPAAAGGIGEPPAPPGQVVQMKINAKGRLETPEQFGRIVLRTGSEGGLVHLRDVADIELGAQSYGGASRFSGRPSAQIAVFQSPDANALRVINGVEAELEKLKARFPEGMQYEIAFDTTRFVSASIRSVVKAMLIAIALVIAVTFLFLQKWRTTIVPAVVIPVALIGSFALMYVLGFSVNQLTLLGLVLAVGLVVDDAIVVTEDVERNIQEEGLEPRDAARRALGEVASPVVATTLVLFALFIPVAFTPGVTGLLYNQFALTVAIAVGLSSLLSLTLTPAMCGALLKKEEGRRNRVFRAFNSGFDRAADGYRRSVGRLARVWPLLALALIALLGATVWLFLHRPTAFVPQEDQGYLVANVQLPAGAALNRTEDVVFEVERIVRDTPGVQETVAIAGSSFVGSTNASYYGFVLPVLEPWSERDLEETGATELVATLRRKLAQIPEARVQVFNAPPIPGIGQTGGVTMQIQALANQSAEELEPALRAFIAAANRRPEVARAFTTFTTDVPQLSLEIDRAKAERMGVGVDAVFATLQTYLGSYFINEFNRFGRTYRVYAQARAEARDEPSDIGRLSVLNREGAPAPLDTLVDVSFNPGAETITHFNLYTSAQVNAQSAAGVSSGELISALEETAREALPRDYGFAWTGAAYQQQQGGGYALAVFGLAILLVFLVLAAQFESLLLPAVIILVVPLAMFGALGFLALRGISLDVFAQIGLLMLVGLAAKNSILLVKFARDRRAAGAEALEAAAQAARMRLRPILMTAVSFILGAVPLTIASGAGANARISLGTTVVGGMLVATLLSLIFVPVAFLLVERLRTRRSTA